ncbi:hypothetical protein LINGRAHAP2_LOCUS22570, partial [Linum grandiflorum]
MLTFLPSQHFQRFTSLIRNSFRGIWKVLHWINPPGVSALSDGLSASSDCVTNLVDNLGHWFFGSIYWFSILCICYISSRIFNTCVSAMTLGFPSPTCLTTNHFCNTIEFTLAVFTSNHTQITLIMIIFCVLLISIMITVRTIPIDSLPYMHIPVSDSFWLFKLIPRWFTLSSFHSQSNNHSPPSSTS